MTSIAPEALVLVAVLPDPHDLEIARVLGWYRIPYKRAPRTIDVDYIAFYHTAKFGAEKWAIHYVAPVAGHELTTRRELLRDEPDHPRAGDKYFKIQLGAVERLPRPIPSQRWRRVTFFYTTGDLLLAAEEINDLIVGGPERDLLWRALRERGLHAEKSYQPADGLPELDLALLCALGNLGITIGGDETPDAEAVPTGWTQLHFSEDHLKESTAEYVAVVAERVAQLGGQRSTEGDV
ncbi:MAG: hypothetical protein ACE5FI_07930 [Anaerolineales bacterium]